MRLAVLAAVLVSPSLSAAGTIDEAFPPTIRVGRPSAGVVVHTSLQRGELAWLALDIVTGGFTQEVAVPIDLPAGARVIGIELERDDRVAWGRPLPAREATARYYRSGTPALVSWAGSSADEDHLVVGVRCTTMRAVVTLALELPASSNLRIESMGRLAVDGRSVRGPASVAIEPYETSTSSLAVDAGTSLFVETDLEPIAISFGSFFGDSFGRVDKRTIRRVMKVHQAQLRRCYMRVAEWHPDLEGKVVLHFMIEDDGRVSRAAADGDLASDDVKTCLADELATWEFPAPRDGRVVVNYPLEFRLRR